MVAQEKTGITKLIKIDYLETMNVDSEPYTSTQ